MKDQLSFLAIAVRKICTEIERIVRERRDDAALTFADLDSLREIFDKLGDHCKYWDIHGVLNERVVASLTESRKVLRAMISIFGVLHIGYRSTA